MRFTPRNAYCQFSRLWITPSYDPPDPMGAPNPSWAPNPHFKYHWSGGSRSIHRACFSAVSCAISGLCSLSLCNGFFISKEGTQSSKEFFCQTTCLYSFSLMIHPVSFERWCFCLPQGAKTDVMAAVDTVLAFVHVCHTPYHGPWCAIHANRPANLRSAWWAQVKHFHMQAIDLWL